MVRVSVVGASGYGGGELVRLLAAHPDCTLVHLTAETRKGEPYGEVFPNLRGIVPHATEEADPAAIAADSDVVFFALPNGVPMTMAPALGPRVKIVDLGADFRFRDPATYAAWYRAEHAAPGLLAEAVYGQPELHREAIRAARIVGNPGCYPTAALIAAAPFVRTGVVERDGIVVDAKSGVSGAGRGVSAGTHFSEVNENVRPYNVAAHRHAPEIEQELAALAGAPVTVTFVPHLIPMTRGILTTVYMRLAHGLTAAEAEGVLREAYAQEPFVRVLAGGLPQTKATFGSNYCDVAVRVDARARLLIAMAAIDNLVKGASGQAIQNMNLMCGLPERCGLEGAPLYP
ncbi:MAG: N-acetyl-gamma-glutamyl-phosphate reductase [Armatimonadota bacterium]|nr:N-acetyl-gamma-glutamyl-phosphate reductase [Armatimonadota bacterium]MDR7457828.1 N-acetyl-gamma-glutamyl-phosphate reductase [Armatimonadota bacterium]MDR7495601.1 N-acetyl-gamma-glutamyl-phosphate reductase [Armatimonadota bacterium]MDR7512668.1 N-acetyl-gamma-glutamyl-phosphate reductase [Armatimonadota bacterium]